MRRAFLLFALLAAAGTSKGIVVSGAADATSTAPPADDFGFANIAQVFNTADNFPNSGVYLGHGWLISAYHTVRDRDVPGGFKFGQVTLDGATHTVDGATAVRVVNPEGVTPRLTDLAVFRLTLVPPNLSGVAISDSVPALESPLILAGNGRGRAATETRWDTSTNPWTVTPTGTRRGFEAAAGQTVRWGANLLSSSGSSFQDPFGTQAGLRATFTADTPGEAHGAAGDSGGGLFYKDGNQWELLGLVLATAPPSGAPPGHPDPGLNAIHGDETYFADLSVYRDQIAAIIPEPGLAGLFTAGAIVLGLRRRRPSPPRDSRIGG